MKFADLGLIDPILKAAADIGYEEPSPIQAQAIQPLLAGKDLIGCAQTGTGKTAAFAMPVLQRLSGEQSAAWCPTRALVLTPTRELALQICESFEAYGKYLPLKVTVVFGGVPQHPQEVALRHGVDVLVATPGRLLDLVGQQLVDLSEIELFVLDEADRMLDMGFLPDVRRVIGLLPTERQTMLFSATMPDEIAKLAQSILHDPVRVAVDPVSSTVDAIDQEVYFVAKENKRALLATLLRGPRIKNALVFVRTKHGADKVARDLTRDGIRADSIHGDKTQTARQYALTSFKDGQTRVLVATDIAARGIDIDELAFVINYDMPSPAENYVHRIGRTGRAGHTGNAISFCDSSEYPYLLDVEKLTGKRVPVVEEHPYALEQPSVGRRGQKARPVERPKKDVEAKPAAKPERENTRKPERDNARKSEKPVVPAAEKNSAPTPVKAVVPTPVPEKPKAAPEKPVQPSVGQAAESRRPERAPRESRETARPVVPTPETAAPRPQTRPRSQEPSRSAPSTYRSVPEAGARSGLPTIRDLNPTLGVRETLTVQTNDQLPKPAPGHFLLNSFADTGVDYYMTENPEADNEAIESLGFYTPPAGALRAIYGDEYDGNDLDFTIKDEPLAVPISAGELSGDPMGKKRKRSRHSRSRSAAENDVERSDAPVSDAVPDAGLSSVGESVPKSAERRNPAPAPKPVERRNPVTAPGGQKPPRPSRPENASAPSVDEFLDDDAPVSAQPGGKQGANPGARSGNRPRRRRPRAPRPPLPDAAQPSPEGVVGARVPNSGASDAPRDPQKQSSPRRDNPRRRPTPPPAAPAGSDGIVTKSEQPFYGEN